MKRLFIFAIGVIVGAAIAIPAFRSSRNPDTLLGQLRTAIHVPPQQPTTEELEARELARRYGPSKHSQSIEEWIVRDFFHDKRDGVFVDVGAADYQELSNTYYLEHELGWSGVAVDAQDRYRADWLKFRPRSRFFTAFVSDKSNETARLFLTNSTTYVASSQEDYTKAWGRIAGSVDVQTITLNDLLAANKVSSFDFLSLDIELAEPKALAGLDIGRYKPSLVCVEAFQKVRQEILDYFAANHYTVVGKYLRTDTLNLWFMPAGTVVEPYALATTQVQ